MAFIHYSNKGNDSTINTDHLCNIVLNGKKIEFYFDTMTSRENWVFEDEAKAKETYKSVVSTLGAKSF